MGYRVKQDTIDNMKAHLDLLLNYKGFKDLYISSDDPEVDSYKLNEALSVAEKLKSDLYGSLRKSYRIQTDIKHVIIKRRKDSLVTLPFIIYDEIALTDDIEFDLTDYLIKSESKIEMRFPSLHNYTPTESMINLAKKYSFAFTIKDGVMCLSPL